jgi:hypothetical protein
VVQGQIGGESRPGSPSAASESLRHSLENSESCQREQPSGRLLEPRRESRPRGMIVRALTCQCSTESGLQARPLFSITYGRFFRRLCHNCDTQCRVGPLVAKCGISKLLISLILRKS